MWHHLWMIPTEKTEIKLYNISLCWQQCCYWPGSYRQNWAKVSYKIFVTSFMDDPWREYWNKGAKERWLQDKVDEKLISFDVRPSVWHVSPSHSLNKHTLFETWKNKNSFVPVSWQHAKVRKSTRKCAKARESVQKHTKVH
jgi:hypothetical protein